MSDVNQAAINIEKIVLKVGQIEITLSLAEARCLQATLNDLLRVPGQTVWVGPWISYGTWTGSSASGTHNTSSSGATVSPAASSNEVT